MSGVLDIPDGGVQPDVQPLSEGGRYTREPVADRHVAPRELELVVLVPMFQREGGQRGGVRELQVGQVPVQYLTVTKGQVHVTRKKLYVSVSLYIGFISCH